MSTECKESVWLDIDGAVEYLKISKTTLYEAMKDKRLPYYYVKGTRQRRLRKQDLDNLMQIGNPDDGSEDQS